MLNLRYEEYDSFSDKIPFKLFSDIERKKNNLSDAANWHDALEIQICLDGCGCLLIDGREYEFSKNDIAIINSRQVHYTGTNNSLTYDCFIIDRRFSDDSDINVQKLLFQNHIKDNTLKKYLTELKLIYNGNNVLKVAYLREHTLKILIYLRENYILNEKKSEYKSRELEITKNAIRFIRENYSTKISVDMIAKSVASNRCMLSEAFKKMTGQTIVSYINQQRCRAAAELISSGMTVSEAAQISGFNNMSFFTKTFKKIFSELPSEYKKRC